MLPVTSNPYIILYNIINIYIKQYQGKFYDLGRVSFPDTRLPLRSYCNPLIYQPRQFLRSLATLLGYCAYVKCAGYFFRPAHPPAGAPHIIPEAGLPSSDRIQLNVLHLSSNKTHSAAKLGDYSASILAERPGLEPRLGANLGQISNLLRYHYSTAPYC